jgi:hypothetical protein
MAGEDVQQQPEVQLTLEERLRLLTVTVTRGSVSKTVTIPDEFAPALRSALEEIRNELGGRLEGAFTFAREQAITNASTALGTLSSAINAAVPAGDDHYAS